MTKEIQLTQGKVALVDDDLYDYLNQWKWYFNDGYAVRRETGAQKRIKMHRLIMNAPNGIEVDHINRVRSDNRRANLRLCTKAENRRNASLRKDNSCGYRGVYWKKSEKIWIARIRIDGRQVDLGRFEKSIDAAKAYNIAAREYYKEFANINIFSIQSDEMP